jgi:hypothetical protein
MAKTKKDPTLATVIRSAKLLRLKPGDILWINLPKETTAGNVFLAKKRLQGFFEPRDICTVICPEGFDPTVIRPSSENHAALNDFMERQRAKEQPGRPPDAPLAENPLSIPNNEDGPPFNQY